MSEPLSDAVVPADAAAAAGVPVPVVVVAARDRLAVLVGLMAGVLYNAWPLGFRLDPDALHGTYVSVLEVPSRPYAHLFVTCDVLAGVLAACAGLLLRRSHPLVGIGLVVFGLGNVLEASIPIAAACAGSVASCGIALDQVLAPHDVASIISVVGIILALWGVRDRGPWVRALIALWAICGLFMVSTVVTDRLVTLSQACFLVACGLALAAVPLALTRPWAPSAAPDQAR